METLAGIAAVLSAATAIVAVSLAYRSTQRANRPSVWANVRGRTEGGGRLVEVQLFNGGPGIALDVVAARSEPTGNPDDLDEWREHDLTRPVRVLGNGERLPP